MTDDELALLKAVLAAPDDDLPRLVLADWWQEHGREDRAEFVRVQCELARLKPAVDVGRVRRIGPRSKAGTLELIVRFAGLTDEAVHGLITGHDDDGRGDVWYTGKMLTIGGEYAGRPPPQHVVVTILVMDHPHAAEVKALRRRERELLGEPGDACRRCDWHAPIPHGGWAWKFRRGFVESVACPAAAWLEHGDKLYWRPGAKGLPGLYGTGWIDRPCPPTAQPVRTVRLTDYPGDEFTGLNLIDAPPIRKFTHHRWPGVTFELPPEWGYDPRMDWIEAELRRTNDHLRG